MRKDSRGLVRARRVEHWRLRELMGRLVDAVVRTDEASGGMMGSAAAEEPASTAADCASLRDFCRRRCGRSTAGMVGICGDVPSFAGTRGSDAVNEVDVDERPLETMAAWGRKELLRK